MSSLHSTIFQHNLPEAFKKHPNSPWKPIKGLADLPFILTIDCFDAAVNLWQLNDELGIRLVIELVAPPRFPSQIWWAICSPVHDLLLIGYPCAARDYSNDGLLCRYAMGTGERVGNDMALPEGFDRTKPLRSGDYLAVTSLKRNEGPSYLIYKLSNEGLQELRRIRGPGDPTIGGDSLVPLCIFTTGDGLLTMRTKLPWSTIILTNYAWSSGPIHSRDLILPAYFEDTDSLTATVVTLPSPHSSYIALVIEESESKIDYHPHYRRSTICLVDISKLCLVWRTPIPHNITQMTHHPSLDMFVALGTQYQPEPNYIITFIDYQTGKVHQERKYSPESGRGSFKAGCTSDDYFVLIYQSGRMMRVPLEHLMNEGFPVDEDNNILLMQNVPDRPEPYTAKARKRGDRWRWIDKTTITEAGLVLFPARGPDVYFVKW